MHEATTAAALTATLPEAAPIERAGNIASCQAFFSLVDFSAFDRFIEQGRSFMLDAASRQQHLRFHEFIRSLDFRISSPMLLEHFFELDQTWEDALSFDNWFAPNEDSELMHFKKPSECPPGALREHAREEFIEAIEAAHAALSMLIRHIRSECGTEAIEAAPALNI
jgi:hypothetical protein